MNLELGKFDMKQISFKPNENKGPVVVLIGRRDTGKSFLVRDLLYYHQDIPIGTVISGTPTPRYKEVILCFLKKSEKDFELFVCKYNLT